MSILLHHFAEMSCANFASCTSLLFVVFNLTSQQFARNAAISKALLAYWTSLQFVYFKLLVLFFLVLFFCSIFRFLALPFFFWRGAYCSLRKIYWVGAGQHPAEQEGAKSILQRRNLAACKSWYEVGKRDSQWTHQLPFFDLRSNEISLSPAFLYWFRLGWQIAGAQSLPPRSLVFTTFPQGCGG